MKLLEVGSRCGVTGFGRPTWPAIGPLETGKNEVVLSENGWSGCACAIERFRGGDARELAACGVVPAEASPQAGRAALHSVSESATSEPEPVLRSGLSALAPASVLLSVRGSETAAPTTIHYLDGMLTSMSGSASGCWRKTKRGGPGVPDAVPPGC